MISQNGKLVGTLAKTKGGDSKGIEYNPWIECNLCKLKVIVRVRIRVRVSKNLVRNHN